MTGANTPQAWRDSVSMTRRGLELEGPRSNYPQQATGDKTFCVKWNLGKCTKNEKDFPDHRMHVCSLTENGKTCMSAKHRSCNLPKDH